MSWSRAITCWFALAALMILNGVGRQTLLQPFLSPLQAHQISSLSGVVLILGASWCFVPWIGARTRIDQIVLGLAWLACTVTFEFTFGHWVAGHAWVDLLADYDLAAGRLWSIVLLATALSPLLIGKAREFRAG